MLAHAPSLLAEICQPGSVKSQLRCRQYASSDTMPKKGRAGVLFRLDASQDGWDRGAGAAQQAGGSVRRGHGRQPQGVTGHASNVV